MMHMIMGAVIALALGQAACMPTGDSSAPAEARGPIIGEGIVTAVDVSARTVTLDHQPIEAIGWSAMTMRFTAADVALLSGVAVGDRVRFELRSNEDPRTIIALSKP